MTERVHSVHPGIGVIAVNWTVPSVPERASVPERHQPGIHGVSCLPNGDKLEPSRQRVADLTFNLQIPVGFRRHPRAAV